MKRTITTKEMKEFKNYLVKEEKSKNTVEKYMRDIKGFSDFLKGKSVDKRAIMEYKMLIEKRYTVSGANSVLAAINGFFRFKGWYDVIVKQFKIQKIGFCPEEKELTSDEYFRLVATAEKNGNRRLSLLMQTLCATGIRISELEYITVAAVKSGEAVVNCKGKRRMIIIVPELCKKLDAYVKEKNISGAVFQTSKGKPVSRSNIWREMKALATKANVKASKIFPHNFRHLFARSFYEIDKDIVRLADVLGHSDVNTTRIYTASTSEEYRKKMMLMRLIP